MNTKNQFSITDKSFAVIFDMDGVLVDNSSFHHRAWQMICEKYKITKTSEDIKSIIGGTNDLFVAKLFGKLDENKIKAISIEKEALYREIYKDHISFPEGLLNLLNELKKDHIPMAVATSAPKENLDFVLDNLNIRGFFKVLIDEAYARHGKPDPEIYRVTASQLNIAAEKCIVIEDSVFGIQSAKANNMKVIAITTTYKPEQLNSADLIIESFKEINKKRIEELLSSK